MSLRREKAPGSPSRARPRSRLAEAIRPTRTQPSETTDRGAGRRGEPASSRSGLALRPAPEASSHARPSSINKMPSVPTNTPAVKLAYRVGSSQSSTRLPAITAVSTRNRQRTRTRRHQSHASNHEPAMIHPVTIRVFHVDHINERISSGQPGRQTSMSTTPPGSLIRSAGFVGGRGGDFRRGFSPPPRQRLESIGSIGSPESDSAIAPVQRSRCSNSGRSAAVVITRASRNGTIAKPCCSSVVNETWRPSAFARLGTHCDFGPKPAELSDPVDRRPAKARVPAAEPLREGQLAETESSEPVVERAEQFLVLRTAAAAEDIPGRLPQPECRGRPSPQRFPDRWRSSPGRSRRPSSPPE